MTVTFSALSQGILINSGNLVGGDDVRVYFDSVTFDPEPNDTAKTYIRLYDGQNYTNTSGMTPSIGSDNIGIQINSSSRFESHGDVLSHLLILDTRNYKNKTGRTKNRSPFIFFLDFYKKICYNICIK